MEQCINASVEDGPVDWVVAEGFFHVPGLGRECACSQCGEVMAGVRLRELLLLYRKGLWSGVTVFGHVVAPPATPRRDTVMVRGCDGVSW